MRKLQFTWAFIVLAGLSSAAWGQGLPEQQPSAQQSQQGDQSQQAQQPASLADVARKYREEKAAKEKSGAPQGVVYTNEGVLPKGAGDAFGFWTPPSGNPASGTGAKKGAQRSISAEDMASLDKAEGKLDQAMQVLNSLAAVDRATLAYAVLEGNNADFPGRKQWEDRLMAGRDYYVSHGRQLIQMMSQSMAYAKSLATAEPDLTESDPRVQALMARMKALTTDSQKTGEDFKRLVEEGQALAKRYQARQN
jgi:hypothetical protein